MVLYFVGAQLLMPEAITLDSYSESHQPICATKPREVTLIVPEKTVDEYKAMARIDREKFLCAERETGTLETE